MQEENSQQISNPKSAISQYNEINELSTDEIGADNQPILTIN